MKKLVAGLLLAVFCSCVLAETNPPAGGAATGAGEAAVPRTVPNAAYFVVGVLAAAALAASNKANSTTTHK